MLFAMDIVSLLILLYQASQAAIKINLRHLLLEIGSHQSPTSIAV